MSIKTLQEKLALEVSWEKMDRYERGMNAHARDAEATILEIENNPAYAAEADASEKARLSTLKTKIKDLLK